MHGSDACIELEGFGSDPTLPLMFPQTHGLLHLHSPFTLHSLSPPSSKLSTLVGGGRFNNLAFKLKRKAFVVETMHLDVEGGVGERRTKPVESVVGGKAGEVKEMEEGKLQVHGKGCGHDHGGGELEKAEGGGGGKVRIGVEEEGGGSSGGVRFGGLDEDEEKRKEEKAAAAKPRKSALKKRSVGFVDASKVDPKKLEF
jgi:elongator complex protein 4